MDDEIIEDIADAFAEQLNCIKDHPTFRTPHYEAAIFDNIIAMAIVINRWTKTYDLRYFYQRAGYPEPYPQHDIH